MILVNGVTRMSVFDMKRRVDASRAFLELCAGQEDKIIRRIVTGDEIIVHHCGKTNGSFSEPTCTLMSTFWDCEGILSIAYLPYKRSINGKDYADSIHGMVDASRQKRSSFKDLLLHDNCSAHKSKHVRKILSGYGISELPHPPYSPDLSPTDYHLFFMLKKRILKEESRNLGFSEIRTLIEEYLRSLSQTFFYTGIQSLSGRCRQCLRNKGGFIRRFFVVHYFT